MRTATLELLSWISQQPRTYLEAIELWRTNCPQNSVWEDALAEQLIEVVRNGSESRIALTPRGAAALSG